MNFLKRMKNPRETRKKSGGFPPEPGKKAGETGSFEADQKYRAHGVFFGTAAAVFAETCTNALKNCTKESS